MALAQRPEGLAAVVSQEPVVDGYRYLYMNRVPFSNRLSTPALFQVIDFQPGHPQDDPEYHISSLPKDPVLLRGQRQRPAEPRPRVGLLEAAQPRRRGQGRHDADVHDGRLPRGQHEARPRLGAVEQPRRDREPRLVRPVGPRPRHRPRHRRRATRSSSARRWPATRASPRRPRASSTGTSRGCRRPRRRRTWTRRSSSSPTTAASARSRRGRPPTSSALRTTLLGGEYVDDGGNVGTGEGGGDGLWTFSAPLAQTVAPRRRADRRPRPRDERARRQPRRERLRRRARRAGDDGQPRRLPHPRHRPPRVRAVRRRTGASRPATGSAS